jgi:hypothetical protein
MEDDVERPLCRTLFRQASHETRLSPTVPSDPEECESENDTYGHPLPRVVDVLVKKQGEVKTRGQFIAKEPQEVITDRSTSQTNNENELSPPRHETGKSDTPEEHGVDHGYTQEKETPTTFQEKEFQDETDVSVFDQKTERPITTQEVESERSKQDDKRRDNETESVGTLKGKTIRANKCQNY